MRRIVVVVLIGLALAGCNGVSQRELLRRATADTGAFCDLAQPIYWSRKDTLPTIQQVKLHNAVGKICGWRGK